MILITSAPPSRDALTDAISALEPHTLGHALTRSARLLNERAVRAVHAAGFVEVRESWLGLLRHMEPAGIRSSELADRLAVSRQAAGQLVSELENHGYLERIPDPSDGRAKLVRITTRGLSAWLAGLQAVAALEDELRAALGAPTLDALRAQASRLLATLESE